MKRTLILTLSAPPEIDDQRVARLVEKLLAGGTELCADIVGDERRRPEDGSIIDEQDALKLSDFDVVPAGPDRSRDALDDIRSILWETVDGWDPEKEWDSETIEYIAGVLEDMGLKPEANQIA